MEEITTTGETMPVTYEVAAAYRSWKVALTPEGRALSVKVERQLKSSEAYFHSVWQRNSGNSEPWWTTPSGQAITEARKLLRRDSSQFRAEEERIEAQRRRYSVFEDAWHKVRRQILDDEPAKLTGHNLTREDARLIGERFLRYAETGE